MTARVKPEQNKEPLLKVEVYFDNGPKGEDGNLFEGYVADYGANGFGSILVNRENYRKVYDYLKTAFVMEDEYIEKADGTIEVKSEDYGDHILMPQKHVGTREHVFDIDYAYYTWVHDFVEGTIKHITLALKGYEAETFQAVVLTKDTKLERVFITRTTLDTIFAVANRENLTDMYLDQPEYSDVNLMKGQEVITPIETMYLDGKYGRLFNLNFEGNPLKFALVNK